MNKDFYRKLHDFVLEHGWLHKLVTDGVKILPGIVYAAYPLLIVSLLIALSRVMAGVHYVKDVLAGWLLGAAVGLLGFLI